MRDLLQQPLVAVRIAEGGERAVGGTVRRGTADATVALEPVAERALVEHLRDLDAGGDELAAGGLDVRDDQIQVLDRPRRDGGDARAELDRARRAGRREL